MALKTEESMTWSPRTQRIVVALPWVPAAYPVLSLHPHKWLHLLRTLKHFYWGFRVDFMLCQNILNFVPFNPCHDVNKGHPSLTFQVNQLLSGSLPEDRETRVEHQPQIFDLPEKLTSRGLEFHSGQLLHVKSGQAGQPSLPRLWDG